MSISKRNEVKLAAEAIYSDGFARRVLELFILQLKGTAQPEYICAAH